MKNLKKLCSIIVAFAMILAVLPSVPAKAATKDKIPTKARLQGGSWDDSAIELELADSTQSIDKIKTNSKDLVAKLTGININSNGNEKDECKYKIGLYAKKNGTYKVTFDIVDQNGDKVSSKEVTVYAYDSALKSVTVDGKIRSYSIVNKKSGKVKVVLQPGNKIKKVEYGYYKKTKNSSGYSSSIVYKEFKNGSKVNFTTQGYEYLSEYSNEYSDQKYYSKNFDKDIMATTWIKVTYVDKYTKQNETLQVCYYNLAK